MAQMYSSPNYQTPQGQQFDTNQQIVQAASGNFSGLPSNQQLGQQAADTTQGLSQMQTPDARGQYVQNSDIPAMQANYDDLAKQLFKYDQMNLQPQYGGQPTQQPSDVPSFGRVEASTLSQLTPDSVSSGAIGMKNSNPAFGIAAQATQGNSLVDLLSNLNSAIDKEFSSRKDTYASAVKSKQTLLDSIFQLMSLKSQEEARREAAAQRASDKADSARDKADSQFYSAVSDGVSQLQKGEDWGTVWNRIKAQFPHRSDAEIDSGLGNEWKKPGAYENFLSKGLDVKQGYKTGAGRADFTGVAKGANTYLDAFNKAGIVDKLNPTSPTWQTLTTQRSTLGQLIAKLIENGRLSNQDRQFYVNLLPNPADPTMWIPGNANAKVQGFMDAVKSNLKTDEDRQAFDQALSGGNGGGSANDPLGIR